MLIEKLPAEERNLITKVIRDFACSGMNDSTYEHRVAPLDFVLRLWDREKSAYLYQLLGEQFDISKPIVFEKDDDEIYGLLDDYTNRWGSSAREFRLNFGRWVKEYCDYDCGSTLYYDLFSLLDDNVLCSNVYDGEQHMITLPNGEVYNLNHGCKASKALGKLANAFHLENYEDFRLGHSRALNEKRMTGELHLSIHPLDYMTASMNDCNWESCMSWDDGEYRQGTVEMMNSKCVVVAYLKAKDDMYLSGEHWNNKKWREFMIVDPDFIVGIKGYPYWNRALEDEALKWLRELAITNMGWRPYGENLCTFPADKEWRCNEFNTKIFLHFQTNRMYNDFYSEHHGYMTPDLHGDIYYNYSGRSECMCCGNTDDEADFCDEGFLVCDCCDAVYTCTGCDDRYHDRDAMWEVDGELLCDYCYHELDHCARCDSPHFSSNFYKIQIGSRTHNMMNKCNVLLCDTCYGHLLNEGILTFNVKRLGRRSWDGEWLGEMVYIEDLTDEQFGEYFGSEFEDRAELEEYFTDEEDRWNRWDLTELDVQPIPQASPV